MIERDGKKYKIFYGMSSSTAMQKHAGGVANYRSVNFKKVLSLTQGRVIICLNVSKKKSQISFEFIFDMKLYFRSSEGKTVEVPYRGNVHDTVKDILGGVRSTCTYVGAEKLKELSRRTTFIRVTMQLNNVFS